MLLKLTDRGLYCPLGDFYIDPWKPVDRAIITHGHSDHARYGMKRYLCAVDGKRILQTRLGEVKIDTLDYGEKLTVNGVRVSLHPAGHILGSVQVRLEHQGEVAVVSGDYKTESDPTCRPFELLKCNLFVTESTFGLPIYRWPGEAVVAEDIHRWWQQNQQAGKASLLMGYALGKSQRALGYLDPSIGPIFQHGAVDRLTKVYREEGVNLPPTRLIGEAPFKFDWSQALILAPPSANGTPWMRRFRDVSTAFMSGWMAVRGMRRRSTIDRGFVLSDHVDWPSLIATIAQTNAECVWVTHGYANIVVRYLQEQGIDARVLQTLFEGEQEGINAEPEEAAENLGDDGTDSSDPDSVLHEGS